MNQIRLDFRANRRLHAEMPRLALLDFVHLGIMLARAILGQGQSGDDRHIQHRYFSKFSKPQPLEGQRFVDDRKEALG